MKRPKLPRPLRAAQLRWTCDPRTLGFRTTSELACCDDIVGQARALAAMRLGLEFHSPGYNVFVTGLTGTGKTTAIVHLLHDLHLPGGAPPDLCYVHNFRQPETPRALALPAGRGRALRKDLHDLADQLRRTLPPLYESAPYKQAHARIVTQFRERIRGLFDRVDRRVRDAGFRIVQIEAGTSPRPEIFAAVGGKPVSMADLEARAATRPALARTLPQLLRRHAQLAQQLDALLRRSRGLERDLRAALDQLVREFGTEAVHGPLVDLRERWAAEPQVLEFLAAVEENVLESLDRVAAAAEASAPADDALVVLDTCRVNLVVDNFGVRRPPVVVETAPTFRNLFGGVERSLDRQGLWRTDHMHIRAGSLLRANGGYLVFNLNDAGAEPMVWPTLKRVLRNMSAEIPSYDPFTGGPGGAIKPDPVALHLKVVVIGDGLTYHHLYEIDDDFRAVFKVKADFDSTMNRTRTAVRDYARTVASVIHRERLLPFDAGAVAAVLEVGARLAGRQTKLSTRFSEIADVVRESHYWAAKDGARRVRAPHVERAVRERIHRVGLVEAKLQEAFETGQILIDLRGRRIGQVNALTVFDYGDHVFGRPARITSQVSMGRSGIVNIERESNLSGATHDKGVLILAGYLRALYAQDKPLTLSASLAFEQSYGGVDGDSATAAEVFALLSAIANLPIRQDIAITGSVDQRGQMQPVGSVNEKIEGFYDVCHARGLSGTQGVLLPAQNAADLMLRRDVVDAVRRRRFHVHPVRTIDEGIALLFGMRAGRRRRQRWERDSVHARVDDALFELVEGIKDFVDGNDTPTGGRSDAGGIADDDGDEGGARRRVARRGRTS
jgi:ATP-dependent Lon protease